MNKSDDFDLDFDNDLSFDSDSESTDEDDLFSSSSSDESNELDELNDENTLDRKETKKSAFKVIIMGIIFVVVIFGVVGLIQKLTNRDKIENKPNKVVETQKIDNKNNAINTQTPVVNNPITSNQNDWKEFTGSQSIEYIENLIDSTFSITSIKNYVKIVDEYNLEMKTIISGAMSGFTGTYEIELPYSKGKLLNIGDKFSVQVKTGKYNDGRLIVDEIIY